MKLVSETMNCTAVFALVLERGEGGGGGGTLKVGIFLWELGRLNMRWNYWKN